MCKPLFCVVVQDAAKAQQAAEEELKQAQEALKKAKDGKAKKEAEEAEKTAKLKQKGILYNCYLLRAFNFGYFFAHQDSAKITSFK